MAAHLAKGEYSHGAADAGQLTHLDRPLILKDHPTQN